jgi:hypothetical protein
MRKALASSAIEAPWASLALPEPNEWVTINSREKLGVSTVTYGE